MITLPRKTESVIPISISQTLDDGDTAVFILKSGSSVLIQKEIIQNGDRHIIHLDASDTADVAVGYYQYSIVVTKNDDTSVSFDGKAYIKEGGPSGTFVRGGSITYSIKLSDDGKTLILIGSDGKISSVPFGIDNSFRIKSQIQYFSDVFKIL